MTEDEIASLLGRELSSIESDNFDLYLEIATENLENLLCMSLYTIGDSPLTEDRTYSARQGYRTLFVDPYIQLHSISKNGELLPDFGGVTQKQYEKSPASWYNSLIFDEVMEQDDEYTVNATWGMNELPATLQLLLAHMFGVVSKKQSLRVKSKSNEGFSVTYSDDSAYDQFVFDYASMINKYQVCDRLMVILHGETSKDGREYI